MKIFIVCHYFYPEIGAPQSRLREMAVEWLRKGHEVFAFTGFPNHPTGVIPEKYKGKMFQKERVDGITVYRHWLYATPNKGFIKKIISHLSFMVSIILLSLFRGPKPDVFVVSSPTLFSACSTWLMSKFRRAPFVFEIRDLWPGIFIELGVLKNRTIIKVLEMIEMFLYRQAKKVVAVTHGFKTNIVARGILETKVHVITNGVDMAFFQKGGAFRLTRQDFALKENDFVALYIGAHGISHGLGSILEAAKSLQGEVKFLFIGEGAVKDGLVRTSQEMGLENVSFFPGYPHENMPDLYRLSDVCLVPLRNIEGFKYFIPSKMFEIMAVPRPIIGAVRGEPAEILNQSGSALVIEPENPIQLVAALRKLKEHPELREAMAQSGLGFVNRYYNRRDLAQEYLRVFEECL